MLELEILLNLIACHKYLLSTGSIFHRMSIECNGMHQPTHYGHLEMWRINLRSSAEEFNLGTL